MINIKRTNQWPSSHVVEHKSKTVRNTESKSKSADLNPMFQRQILRIFERFVLPMVTYHHISNSQVNLSPLKISHFSPFDSGSILYAHAKVLNGVWRPKKCFSCHFYRRKFPPLPAYLLRQSHLSNILLEREKWHIPTWYWILRK